MCCDRTHLPLLRNFASHCSNYQTTAPWASVTSDLLRAQSPIHLVNRLGSRISTSQCGIANLASKLSVFENILAFFAKFTMKIRRRLISTPRGKPFFSLLSHAYKHWKSSLQYASHLAKLFSCFNVKIWMTVDHLTDLNFCLIFKKRGSNVEKNFTREAFLIA